MKYIFGLCYEEQPLEMRYKPCPSFVCILSLLFHVIDIATFTTLIKCLFVYTFRYMICVYEHAHHYHYIFLSITVI